MVAVVAAKGRVSFSFLGVTFGRIQVPSLDKAVP